MPAAASAADMFMVAWCASLVQAASVNSRVWLPPVVGIAANTLVGIYQRFKCEEWRIYQTPGAGREELYKHQLNVKSKYSMIYYTIGNVSLKENQTNITTLMDNFHPQNRSKLRKPRLGVR